MKIYNRGVIKVHLNGETRELDREVDLAEFVQFLSLPTQRIAIELNGRVVRKADWEKTPLHDADRVEMVHFVGGG